MADFNNKNKNKNKNNKQKFQDVEKVLGSFEYKMPKAMATIILKADKSNKTHQEILCDYINTQYNLKGTCTKVIID